MAKVFLGVGHGGNDLKLGKCIEAEIIKIGQNSRGAKTRKDPSTGRDYFGFIRELACPSIIVEGCFLDSNDRYIADTSEKQKVFGQAYAKGILTYFGVSYKTFTINSPSNHPTNNTLFRVIVGSYKIRENAIVLQNKLKEKGFDSFLDVLYTEKERE